MSPASNADQIRKTLFKLGETKDPEQFNQAAEAALIMLKSQSEPIPKDCCSTLQAVLRRLGEFKNIELLDKYGTLISAQVYPHIPDAELRAAVKVCVDKMRARRVEDPVAVAGLYAGLLKEALVPKPATAGACLNYFIALAEEFTDRDDTDDVDVIYLAAVDISMRLNGKNCTETADSYEFLGLCYRNQGYYEDAYTALQQARGIQEELLKSDAVDPSSHYDVLLTICDVARQGGFPEKTQDVFQLLKKLSEENKLPSKLQAQLHGMLGRQAQEEGDEADAIESFKRALEALREMPEDKAALERQRIAISLARVYSNLNEPALVEKYYSEALSVMDKIARLHADEVSDNMYYIACFFSDRHDYRRAEELLKQSLKLKRQAAKHRYVELELIERELATVRKLVEENSKRDARSLEHLLGEIEGMVGLEELKKALREHGVYLDFLRLRKERGFESVENPVLHAVFMGNPGTGKTTVAKLLGEVYYKLGLLSSGHVHTVVRADLIGAQYGAGEKGARRALDAARGGVLFIDEAYTLSRHYREGDVDGRDPGQEVIETLLPVMSNPGADIAIVVAGYPTEMEAFLGSNPGLRSRFKLFFDFPDYTPPEMLEIAVTAAKRHDLTFSDEARKLFLEALEDVYRKRDRTFGNARHVMSLIDDCKRAMALRIMRSSKLNLLTNEQISVVSAEDVRKVTGIKRKAGPYCAPLDEKMLAQSLAQLDALVGLDNLKAFVRDTVKVVRVYRELGKDVLSALKFNLVFAGNPGTGKTVVARIISDVYKALGILERGHLVETDRSGLVGKYIGDSEAQTKAKIEEAMGGVLFVDEAYALMGEGNDFGARVIEVLLKQMEDQRGKFFCIFAGYRKEMQQFMDANPGLRSRIDKVLDFEDYTTAQLERITVAMLKAQDLSVDEEACKALRQKLASIKDSKGFANARSCRNLVERIALRHFASLADIPTDERTAAVLTTVTARTVEETELSDLAVKRPVGF